MQRTTNQWFERLKEGLIGVYDRLPPRVLSLVEPAKVLIQAAVAFVSELWLPVLGLTVEPGDGSQSVKVLFAGRSASLKAVVNLLTPRRYDVRQQTSLPFWKIRRHLTSASGSYDLVIIAVNAGLYCHLKPLGFWHLPEGVRSVLKLENTLEATMKSFQKGTRKAISLFRGREFSWSLSKDIPSLENFYYNSYIPYAKNKFGENAVILSYYWVRRLFNTGFLLTVRKAGKPLAAGICRIRKQTFISELTGIAGGRTELLAEGASQLLDYYCVDYAVAQNCRYLDFGLSRPFLNDGVLRHKRKWGTNLVGRQKANRVIGIRFAEFEPAGLAIFAGSYPVFIDGGGLVGLVVFKTTHRVDLNALKKIEKGYCHRGLKKMIIVSPQGFEDAALQHAKRYLKDRIVLL